MASLDIERLTPPAPDGQGLTSAEAARRLRQYGPNATAEVRPHPVLALLRKFWTPVPWMLEATVLLELVLGRYTEAGIIAALLVFNAGLGFLEEGRAQKALALLRQRLTVQSRVMRDRRWQLLPASELVPGDLVHVRVGDIAPADLRIVAGNVLVDQSMLTGESAPVDIAPDTPAYAGTVVKRGEATGLVVATGSRTAFGKTAELVRFAKTRSHLQAVVFSIVKWLIVLDAVLVIVLGAYAAIAGIPLHELLPFTLMLLVASVPVALPATYTLATALGALELAHRGVLVTRLAAIEEAAGMDVVCSDKTGTITQNRLAVAAVRAYPPSTEADVLRLGAIASDAATQDPIDLAILDGARKRGVLEEGGRPVRVVPFDPSTKRSEAYVGEGDQMIRVVKGAPQIVQRLADGDPAVEQDAAALASQGFRVLAIAAGPERSPRVAGLVALEDPPRQDSRALIRSLRDLGVRVVMVTGDALATALAVARHVGIEGEACPVDRLRADPARAAACHGVVAEVLPEDKFHLVQALQHAGHTVGMTGDGVNDAPALKQAEVGIAVANATDVAKAAASLVLTTPGLSEIVAAIETSRQIYQRMLTYTLNKVVKTCEIALFLGIGLVATGTFVTTPALIVLLLFTNDFVTMSIATDRVTAARVPQRWRIRPLVLTAASLAALILVLSFVILTVARVRLGLPLRELQTLVFVMLVFSGQATVYLVRERRHFWSSAPGRWLCIASIADVLVVGVLATRGILMAPIAPRLVMALFATVVVYAAVIDYVKIGLMRRFRLHDDRPREVAFT